MIFIIYVIAFVAVGFLGSLLLRHSFPYTDRFCQGKNWRQTFPDESKQEIREFLSVFIQAFGFSEKDKLKLSPEDKILDIYRKVYPLKSTPDGLELETLDRSIFKKYDLELRSIWNEKITLGKLFTECLGKNQRVKNKIHD